MLRCAKSRNLTKVVGSGLHSCGRLEGSAFGRLQFPTKSSSNILQPESAIIAQKGSRNGQCVAIGRCVWCVVSGLWRFCWYFDHILSIFDLGSSGLWTCMASDLQFHAVLPLDEVADRCDHQHDVWMWVPSGNWKWATKICPFKNRSFPSLCWILLNCQRVFDGICVFCGFLEVDGISPVPWETRGIFYPLWGGGQHGCWGLLCRWLPISLAAARVLWIAWLHFAVSNMIHDT